MMSTNNILSPANGEPIIVPSQDVVLGLYYMTREAINAKGEGRVFADLQEVDRVFRAGEASLHARVKVRINETIKDRDGSITKNTRIVDTTVGRALLFQIVPEGMSFDVVNQPMKKKAISKLINLLPHRWSEGYRHLRRPADVHRLRLLDHFRCFDRCERFRHPGREGAHHRCGHRRSEGDRIAVRLRPVTQGEKYNKVIDLWSKANDEVSKAMMANLSKEKVIDREGNEAEQDSFNSMYMMADSGARGSAAQIRQRRYAWPDGRRTAPSSKRRLRELP